MRSLASILLAIALPAGAADVEFYNGPGASTRNQPFSEAVRVDDLLILSGIVGTETRTGELVEGGIIPETHQIFVNMKDTLEANGAGYEDVAKCTVMLDDIEEWDDFNAIYTTYFPGDKPARSAFGTNGLALGATVELECWAVIPEDGNEG